MITKQQLIDLWCDTPKNEIPERYKHLFYEDGFKRLVEGTFLTTEEQDYVLSHTHNLYRSMSLSNDYIKSFIWDEQHWIKLIHDIIVAKIVHNNCNFDANDTVCGIVELLGIDLKDVKHVEPERYKRFYDGTAYGYFDYPILVDIANHFNLDINEYFDRIPGFKKEEDVPKFDMCNWQVRFKDSKRITTLKKAVTNGRMLDESELAKNNWGFDIWENEKRFYPNADRMWIIHNTAGKFIPLRQVDNGASYIEELVDEYGYLMGFYTPPKSYATDIKKWPIYKISTKQGFNFYICGSRWHGGVYIDDISIKKIFFGEKKPVNNALSDESRIFVIYNESTGYWRLPELHYPKVYKNFVKDIIKKHKEIGKWAETHVFASSRTLNSIKTNYNYETGETVYTDLYPDVKTADEFISKIANNAVNNVLKEIKLDNKFKSLGLKIEVKYDKKMFDFDNTVKPIPLTQDEINKYCNIETVTDQDIFEITKY